MMICPRCGWAADGGVVCAHCGMSLAAAQSDAEDAALFMDDLGFAEGQESSAREVRPWRLATLVVITCLLVTATAIVLLQQGGSHKAADVLPAPTDSASASGESTPGFPTDLLSRSSTVKSAVASHHPTRSATASRSGTATRSATSSPSAPGASTSVVLTQTSSAIHSPSSSTSVAPPPPPPTVRTVTLARGSLDSGCGPHCYRLVVTLSGFSSGAHQVSCRSDRGTIGVYTTSSTTSSDCAYSRHNVNVWVVVDSAYQSNTVTW